MQEAAEQTWSVRTLQRNISSQYYFRLLKSHNKDLVKKEMLQISPARDNTLLTVGFNLRIRHNLTSQSSRDGTSWMKVSSLRDSIERLPCRRLKPTVNKVLSLRDWGRNTQKRTEGDNPTLGIVLCADTDEDIARYSILNGNEQLFATKYKTYLPSEDELRAEIETQKRLFYLQQNKNLSGEVKG
jgi:hypothetical protein